MACMLKKKKRKDARLMSKKALIDMLRATPIPTQKELQARLLNAGLSAKGSKPCTYESRD